MAPGSGVTAWPNNRSPYWLMFAQGHDSRCGSSQAPDNGGGRTRHCGGKDMKWLLQQHRREGMNIWIGAAVAGMEKKQMWIGAKVTGIHNQAPVWVERVFQASSTIILPLKIQICLISIEILGNNLRIMWILGLVMHVFVPQETQGECKKLHPV